MLNQLCTFKPYVKGIRPTQAWLERAYLHTDSELCLNRCRGAMACIGIVLIMDLAGRDISVAKSGQTILQPCDVSFHVND